MKLEIVSISPGYTFEIGEKFSKLLRGGDILLLSGELGGGKTTFISGLARGLKIKENLSSPSFTILNEYIAGKLRLIHADFYRLDGIGEFENIGLDEYIYDNSSIVCIEWGDKVKKFINRQFLELGFEYIIDNDDSDKRKITLRSNNPGWDKKIEQFGRIIGDKQV